MASKNALLAVQFFIRKGYKPWQARGIVGNLMQESGANLSPSIKGDKGTSHGIAQWRGSRFAELQSFAKKAGSKWNDFGTQLEFVDWELKNRETGAYSRLLKSTNEREATAAFVGYERPLGWTVNNPYKAHGFGNRLKYAMSLG